MRKTGVTAVYLVVFLDMLGFGVMIPVVRDLTKILVQNSGLAWPSAEIYMGILMAVYSGSQMVSAPILGRLSDIYGRKPVFLLSALGNLASYAVWIIANKYWLFLAGRVLSGITGGNIAIAQSILADNTTPEERPRAMGLLGACIGMGFVLGPFLGAFLIKFNQVELIEFNPFWQIGMLGFFLALVAVILISFSRFDRPLTHEDSGKVEGVLAVAASLKDTAYRRIYATQLLSQISFVAFEVLFAWILQKQYHFDLKETFYFFGAQGLVLALIQGGIYRRVEKRKPPQYWVKAGLLGSFVLMCIIPWLGYLNGVFIAGISLKIILLSVVLVLLSVASGFGGPSLNAYASIHAPKNGQGQTMGNMQSLAALARFTAPVLATSLYAFWLPLPFLIGGILCLTAWGVFAGEKR